VLSSIAAAVNDGIADVPVIEGTWAFFGQDRAIPEGALKNTEEAG
jgi:hypothetical protein